MNHIADYLDVTKGNFRFELKETNNYTMSLFVGSSKHKNKCNEEQIQNWLSVVEVINSAILYEFPGRSLVSEFIDTIILMFSLFIKNCICIRNSLKKFGIGKLQINKPTEEDTCITVNFDYKDKLISLNIFLLLFLEFDKNPVNEEEEEINYDTLLSSMTVREELKVNFKQLLNKWLTKIEWIPVLRNIKKQSNVDKVYSYFMVFSIIIGIQSTSKTSL